MGAVRPATRETEETMTTRKLIPVVIAAVLLGAAAASAELPRLPGALKLPQGGDSPGVVTFNHDMHVDFSAPACVGCHPKRFSILGRSAAKRPKELTHEAMERGEACGGCHGKSAFDFGDCTMCHAM